MQTKLLINKVFLTCVLFWAGGNVPVCASESFLAEEIYFPQKQGRYVMLRALSETGNGPWTTVAELGVLQKADLSLKPQQNKPDKKKTESPKADRQIDHANIPQTARVISPDGRISVVFSIEEFNARSGCPMYSVAYKGDPVIVDAPLGLQIRPTPVCKSHRQYPSLVSLPKQHWKLIRADSESKGYEAKLAFDDNPGTIWHSQWQDGAPRHPHEIVIDLGKSYELSGFYYLPRNDQSVNGTVRDYEFYVSEDPKNFGRPVARGKFKNADFVQEDWTRGFEIVEVSSSSSDKVWKPVYGQWSRIRDNYNQIEIRLRQVSAPHRCLSLTLRAYDEGVAFRYTVPSQPDMDKFVVVSESTHFRFPSTSVSRRHLAYSTPVAQERYDEVTLEKICSGCERPLVVKIVDGPFVALTEAALVDYARMKFRALGTASPDTVVSTLGSRVQAETPLSTPWRVILIGDTAGDLLEQSYLILNLNQPCAIDASWIEPGKVYCDFHISTKTGKAAVDAAVAHNMQYIHFDAGWYGFENDISCDATTWVSPAPGWSPQPVPPEKLKGKDPFDLLEVIDYAQKRGIGVILYVNRRHLETQLDEILPVYRKWGIKGMKFGFVNVGSQHWTSWLHEAIRKCADHHILVNIHDEYRPTGYERTYPNLMTTEGIFAENGGLDGRHRLHLLFTRFLTGAADHTHMYFNRRYKKDTKGNSLAKLVAFYSPLQYVYWADPLRAIMPSTMQQDPGIEFIDRVPVVWDDLRVIQGLIGKYATVARRSGHEWYIGSMNDAKERTLDIPLAFLDRNKKYNAHIYSDSNQSQSPHEIEVSRYTVDFSTIIKAHLLPNGGQAVYLVPLDSVGMNSYPPYPDITETAR